MKTICFAIAALVFACANGTADVIQFESYTGGAPALDGDIVTGQIASYTFVNAMVLTAGIGLNEFEAPPHSGLNVVINTAASLSILFDAPATSVGAFVTYGAPVVLTAYDAGMNIIGVSSSLYSSNLAMSGDLGSAPNEYIEFAFGGGISGVSFTASSANAFVLDDVTVSSVPEPGTFGLVAGVVVLTAAARRRRRNV